MHNKKIQSTVSAACPSKNKHYLFFLVARVAMQTISICNSKALMDNKNIL